MEFDNLKTAQFFVRYVTAVQARVTQSGKLFYVSDVLNEMRTFTNADAADLDDEDVVAYVMALQLPKPARKPTPKKKNVQVLAGDECLPGPVVLDIDEAIDTTFALES